jgi:hypothetical protein
LNSARVAFQTGCSSLGTGQEQPFAGVGAGGGDNALEKALARYAGPKGNLPFPLEQPIPYDLVERIVKLRVK